jgi:membrane protein implicated in regulation of membrane protease activity
MFTVSVYLVITIVCLIFLFLVLGLGTDLDMDFDADVDVDLDVDADVDFDADGAADAAQGGPSPFSLPVILTTLTAFGAFGYMLEYRGFIGYSVPAIAMCLSLAVGACCYLGMYKVFRSAQGGKTLKLRDLVGLKATVDIPIQDGEEGRIIVVPVDGGRETVAAISDEDLENDAVVRVIEVVGDKVKVKRVGKPRKKKPASKPKEVTKSKKKSKKEV